MNEKKLKSLIETETKRSSGPGGQNINRRETAVRIRVAVADLPLSDFQKSLLLKNLPPAYLNGKGEILIESKDSRSQKQNFNSAFRKLVNLINEHSQLPKKRIPTKPTAGSKERRLADKKRAGEKKKMRKKVRLDNLN